MWDIILSMEEHRKLSGERVWSNIFLLHHGKENIIFINGIGKEEVKDNCGNYTNFA